MKQSFNISSGKICITDPCYDKGTWCGSYDLPALNGKWFGEVIISDEGDWGPRVSELICNHETFITGDWEHLPQEIGVDSGQAGVFCSGVYPEDDDKRGEFGELDTFYGKVCDITISESWGVIEGGICSSSGYGDGGYDGYCVKNDNGEIIAVKIVFIDHLTDEDDEV